MNNTEKKHAPEHLSFYNRIAFQLGFPLLLFIVVTTLIVGILVVNSFARDSEEARALLQNYAEQGGETIELFLETVTQNIELSARSAGDSEPTTAVEKVFESVVESHPSILELLYLDSLARERLRIGKATTPALISIDALLLDPQFVSSLRDGKEYISPPKTSLYGTPYVLRAMPVKDDAGLVVALVDVSALWERIIALSEQSGADVYLVDGDGNLLVSSARVENKSGNVRDILSLLEANPEGIQYQGLHGKSVHGRAETLSVGWTMVVEVSVETLTKDTRTILAILIILVVFFLSLALSALFIFQRNLAQPLSEFKRKISGISSGDYDTKLEVKSHNELGLLADLVNSMAVSIGAKTADIITRLKRTVSDLDRSSKMLIRRDVELSRANERLRSLDNAKSEFVSIAAHQLRTPLSAIKWAQQILIEGEMGPLSAEQIELVGKSQESIDRMVRLVNDLLNADHLEYGKVQYRFLEMLVNRMLADALGELTAMAAKREVALEYLPGEQEQSIVGDPERLKEVVLNLTNNAIKYTPIGGRVTVRSEFFREKVVISVEDTGIGIPEENRNRLFEKFVRMENAKRVDADGSGLGLFIVEKIVDAHQGKVWFNSIEGKGSIFFVSLPYKRTNR